MSPATDEKQRIQDFIEYVGSLSGDEKGEAQVFCDRLFQAFGHKGYKEAGATLEFRISTDGRGTKYSDLVWKPTLLLEMKKRGEVLHRHYDQLFDYWLHLVPKRPRYAILCNFDEFWIYDFDAQMEQPVDRVPLADLVRRRTAFNFLLPRPKLPFFENNLVDVTRDAADKLAAVFKSLKRRGVDPNQAQRFVLQCLVVMFSEDVDLLPSKLFLELLDDCDRGTSSYDLLGSLFRQMNTREAATGGRYRNVRYFDGGLFEIVDPVELNSGDVLQLKQAAVEDWSKVQPAIFGTLFQSSTDKKARHAYGAHYTSEADISKVVRPTVLGPFRERLKKAASFRDLLGIREDLATLRVLDPACGSGNFLYVAYREMRRLETEILDAMFSRFRRQADGRVATRSVISTRQLFGIDKLPFAIELAKVTLTLARELALMENREHLEALQPDLPGTEEAALPLDNLDENFQCTDALFAGWPAADCIIGNPPFQSKNKMQEEYGRAYLNQLRKKYPEIPGRADYCVYWFRRAHDHLAPGGRAGLVGTNTIRQNYSREGGLDYIVANGGTITEAVSTQVWSGDAAVHVSVVNWVKGKADGRKVLLTQLGDTLDAPWRRDDLAEINSALSPRLDVTTAERLAANINSGACFQGQTHGHEGFLLEPREAKALIATDRSNRDVLFPYLIADDLLGSMDRRPTRYVIDFHPRDLLQAGKYKRLLDRIRKEVLPDREKAAEDERKRSEEAREANPGARVNRHHENFLNKWWLLSYARGEMMNVLSRLSRFIGCSRVTKRPIFEFVDTSIHPNDALAVFALEDDYSFGILQSTVHWEWFTARCSSLKGDYRYTSDTVFDSFCWPQNPTRKAAQEVAQAAVRLRQLRQRVMQENAWTLRQLYRTLEEPGANPLRDATSELDEAVCAAYGVPSHAEPLEFLLQLNGECAKREKSGKPVVGPGIPPGAPIELVKLSDDRIIPD
jgi:type II restriction/modification system DNA methylase subunit YeeA